MKKRIDQLTFGDTVYCAYENSTNYHTQIINKVDNDVLRYGTTNIYRKDNDLTKMVVKWAGDYNFRILVFSNESDCKRYCKAQLMKELFSKIKEATEKVNEVKKFRFDNYQLLNHDYTDRVINQLESEL